MQLRHPNSVRAVAAYRPASSKRLLIAAIFVTFYAISIQFAATTVGEPFRWAIEDEKLKLRAKASVAREKGAAFKSGQREQSLQIDYESLPSEYLPNAWACLLLFLSVSFHFLFHMLCHWSLQFKAQMTYKHATTVEEGTDVLVLPHRNKGQGEMAKVVECEASLKLFFTFHNQKYEVLFDEDANDPSLVDEGDIGCQLVAYPVNLAKNEYKNSLGIRNEEELEKSIGLFGSNIFDLPRPTFLQLFKKQLVSPIVIFQLFCSVLWMVDTYWKYTMFTLVSVIGFEASTAMQRLKSMSQLRTLGGKTYDVYVFRFGQWKRVCITELQPKDIVSLCLDETGDIQSLSIPCDCVMIRGIAVANEANITGESVPQMKDGIGIVQDSEYLDLDKDKINILYSGASLIQTTGVAPKEGDTIPASPDNGVICYVLRTGFSSSQGSLMRMVEFSQENVTGDTKETCMQLLFLFCFALMAAGYVLKRHLDKPEDKPTYRVLLRCVQIITSVVPPSLPMQMAFAVHTALMSLLKLGIYCTEPFRVPEAGKISYVFFDKTGTLTSDQMMGVATVNAESSVENPMNKASMIVQAVLSSCQSLIEVNKQMCGDSIEVAALKGIEWSYSPSTSTATPGLGVRFQRQLETQKAALQKAEQISDAKRTEDLKAQIAETEGKIKQAKVASSKIQIRIHGRHHFLSELARMSTVCDVKSTVSEIPSGAYCFVKGSPEAIKRLISKTPDWYDECYQSMAEKGQRILALAYRKAGDSSALSRLTQASREEVESKLTFAGFVAFKCETRKDSALVIRSLIEADHTAIMLTGDAPLTALSVAQEVRLCHFPDTSALILNDSLRWDPALQRSKEAGVEFSLPEVETLAKSHDLIVTGSALSVLQAKYGRETYPHVTELDEVLHHMHLYVRMSPEQKEQVILGVKHASAVRHRGQETGQAAGTMMCGDGGNDVGALKAADVGLALLSGFGNANVDTQKDTEASEEEPAEDALAKVKEDENKRAGLLQKQSGEELKRRRNEIMSNQKAWLEEEMGKRAEAGMDTGVMGNVTAMKSVFSRVHAEIREEQGKISKSHSTALAVGAQKWSEGFSETEDTVTVKLGDASTAAPFTSRTPSVSSVIDIIRQGRCTLLSAVQQMQIMMLESMISAYTLSAMSVDGTRLSESQMMASSTLMSVASIAFTFARPLDRMHPVRPLRSVFHKAHFFSILGQMILHIGCMSYVAHWAKSTMSDQELQDIIQFEKDRNKKISSMEEDKFEDVWWFLSVPFKPNLLNTVCWLIECSQQVSVLLVNYKGYPWMKGILQNQPLFMALFACVTMVAMCAWGVVPWVNNLLNLVVVPAELRMPLMSCLTLSLVGSFIWDRLMLWIFAPHIFEVVRESVVSTRPVHFFPLLKTVGYILGGLTVLGSGNPIVWGLAFWMYRDYKKKQALKAETQAPPISAR